MSRFLLKSKDSLSRFSFFLMLLLVFESVSSSEMDLRRIIPGSWMETPSLLSRRELDAFARAAFSMPLLGSYLRDLNCEKSSNFIRSIFINLEDLEDMVWKVDCDRSIWYLYMKGYPPHKVQYFPADTNYVYAF